MKKYFWVLALVFVYNASFAQVQFIDANASEITFEVKKFKMFEVEGTFKGMKGTIRFDTAKLDRSSLMVCVDASTVETGNEKRDKHLSSADFFDVEKFPLICFSSNKISKKGGIYVAEGLLSIRDMEKNIELPFTFRDKTFKGEFEINRRDFGVGKDISSFKAGDMIEIEIECVIR